MTKIAFLSNSLTLRGTEVAMYDYADYNETLLGNRSVIITRPYEMTVKNNPVDVNILAYDKFINRFNVFYYNNRDDIDKIIIKENIDILYIIKSGSNIDNLYTKLCKCVIHCVFTCITPHGDVYIPISEYLNYKFKTQWTVLPHMIRLYDTNDSLRSELNIPDDAIVFGTHGGKGSFNIDYIKKVVIDIVNNSKFNNIYFIFLNITPFYNNSNDRLIFLDGTSNMEYKRKFINTCNAMLYGRDNGETFGLCCGEFSMCNKPVIASLLGFNTRNFDKFHIQTLRNNIIIHNDYNRLYDILINWNKYNKDVSNNGYKKYTPEYVMDIFNKIIVGN
jgi:hypothetical protein